MKFIVCIANGSEELESISIIDTLRRTKAMEVIVAKIFEQKETDHTDLKIKASRDCWLVADTVFTKELLMDENVIGIALPGGLGGAQTFAASNLLVDSIKSKIQHVKQNKNKKFINAAICASPALVFGPHGLFEGVKEGTCFPSMQDKLTGIVVVPQGKKTIVQQYADAENIYCVTSQGPCTAVDFALEIATLICGKDVSNNVAKGMLYC